MESGKDLSEPAAKKSRRDSTKEASTSLEDGGGAWSEGGRRGGGEGGEAHGKGGSSEDGAEMSMRGGGLGGASRKRKREEGEPVYQRYNYTCSFHRFVVLFSFLHKNFVDLLFRWNPFLAKSVSGLKPWTINNSPWFDGISPCPPSLEAHGREELGPTKSARLDSQSSECEGGEGGEGGGGGGGKKKKNRHHRKKDWAAILKELNLRVMSK